MNFNLNTSLELAKMVLDLREEKEINLNTILSSFNNGEQSQERIFSKNILLRYQWVGCKNRKKELLINPEIFDCKECKGLGEKYKFINREIKVPCKFCNGTGSANESCHDCNDKNSGKCNICLYHSSCIKCNNGEIKLERTIITDAITCNSCNGTGKNIKNPVLSQELAKKIQSKFLKK